MLTAFYGLRRSEVVGLKWAAVDFEQNTIEICHTVTTVRLDGKEVLVESNGTKTKSSKRTLPLVPVFRERLLALQEEQKENRKLCGRCYNKKYADYICVDAMGNLLKPDYLSNSFQIILQNYHLRRIRFHDLRHSCASLLLANGVPMKMIQEWLGHSDFSTTANIYSHLDYASKVSSAEAMLNGLEWVQIREMTLKKVSNRIFSKYSNSVAVDHIRDSMVDLRIYMIRTACKNDSAAACFFQVPESFLAFLLYVEVHCGQLIPCFMCSCFYLGGRNVREFFHKPASQDFLGGKGHERIAESDGRIVKLVHVILDIFRIGSNNRAIVMVDCIRELISLIRDTW